MTEQEFNDLQRHSAVQDARINNLDTKFEMFMQEMRERDKIRAEEIKDFKNEMRTQNLLRAKEISELNKKHENDMKDVNARIESKFDKLSGQVQNIVIAAVVGVGAVVVGVVSFVVSVINK